MNQNNAFMPSHGHMAHQSVSSTTSAHPPQYAAYQSHQPMHNAMPPYASSPIAYQGYSTYSSGLPMAGGAPAHMMNATMGLPAPGPDGMPRPLETAPNKPKVTATLWEDENTLCFQVEARGVCVARREDNRMINGTKLLNVAGMTRGRRDGILKSEKLRHVIKIGPMHLKGVWIPFERALDFAEREKITEVLYPLFVENINALLYHPGGPARPGVPGTALASASVPDSAERRKVEGSQDYMNVGPVSRMPLSQYQAQGATGYRPLPTPPTSSTASISTPVTNSYEWGQPGSHSLASDSAINRTPASLLHTPIGTPPTSAMGNPAFPTMGGYERQYYGHSSQPSYSSQYSVNRYAGNPHFQTSPVRHEMGPPARIDERDTREVYTGQKPENPSSETGDHEGEAEYTHSAAYAQQHRPYAYGGQNDQPASDHADRQQASTQMGSPVKRAGQDTPRTSTPYQGYDVQHRPQDMPAGGLYYGGHAREDTTAGAEMYNPAYQQNFPPASALNGNGKRGYESFDDDAGAKRLKSGMEERPQGIVGPSDR